MTLPDNTTDRLLAVADLIEQHPESYNQSSWWLVDGSLLLDDRPALAVAQGEPTVSCGTTACIAGWAVALTPYEQLVERFDWEAAGTAALGLGYDVADHLFRGGLLEQLPETEVPDVLRRLAKLPEGERTTPNVAKVLTDEQYRAIYWWEVGDEDEDDDE